MSHVTRLLWSAWPVAVFSLGVSSVWHCRQLTDSWWQLKDYLSAANPCQCQWPRSCDKLQRRQRRWRFPVECGWRPVHQGEIVRPSFRCLVGGDALHASPPDACYLCPPDYARCFRAWYLPQLAGDAFAIQPALFVSRSTEHAGLQRVPEHSLALLPVWLRSNWRSKPRQEHIFCTASSYFLAHAWPHIHPTISF